MNLVDAIRWAQNQYAQLAVDATGPWFGIMGVDRQSLLADCRRLIVRNIFRPDADTRVTGFKEIRWGDEWGADLGAMLDTIIEMFSDTGLVFNSRNLDDVRDSLRWAKHQELAVDRLPEYEARMRDAFERHRERSVWIHYDDYVGNPDALAPLFEFLREPFDLDTVREVMGRTHSIVRPTP